MLHLSSWWFATLWIWLPRPAHGFLTPAATTSTCRKQNALIPPSSTALLGIPKMFRWLTDQYPDVLNRQLEQGLSDDLLVDNFYLDMNGIIHPCTHGNNEGEIVILDETAMFKKIFLYVDRLYKLVQPSKLLYLAVDGVAPRAKMNQQRSRRFRSAKEAEAAASEMLARAQQTGKIPQDWENQKRFDSNCITPGTDFMLKLSLAMQKWVEFKMQTDEFWINGADVIISGPDVPGEGEHKVMDFLREAKEGQVFSKELYQPDHTHVLYGLDADLIMLGLASHEKNFLLLREKMSVVMAGRGRNKYRKRKDMLEYNENDFEVLDLSGLRQMLGLQFRKYLETENLKVKTFELDRIIDDFIFMCMLVGNDFLPHCPHLEIDGGALSLMMNNYMDLLPDWGGYLTKKDKLHPERFEQFMYHLALYEEEHFGRRGYEENEAGWKLSSENEDDKDDFYGKFYSGNPTPECAQAANRRGGTEPAPEDIPMAPSGNRAFRRGHPDSKSRSYRDFYYETKMGWKPEDRSRTLYRRRAHVRDYMEGLHWVMNYYHNGCQSWDYFFPHLYSPLATDLVNLAELYSNPDEEGFCSWEFEKGTPFPSLAQLLSVLPPQSADLLPKPLAELMLHPSSPLLEYYPSDFTADANGKRQSWEAVVQIPFIDGSRLLETVQQVLDADQKGQNILSPGERRRNLPGKVHYVPAPGERDPNRGRKLITTKSSPKRPTSNRSSRQMR